MITKLPYTHRERILVRANEHILRKDGANSAEHKHQCKAVAEFRPTPGLRPVLKQRADKLLDRALLDDGYISHHSVKGPADQDQSCLLAEQSKADTT